MSDRFHGAFKAFWWLAFSVEPPNEQQLRGVDTLTMKR